MGNATFYWDGLKCLIMITVSHFHLTIDWQNNTKPVLIVLLFSGRWEWAPYFTLGRCYFWGLFGAMSFFTLLCHFNTKMYLVFNFTSESMQTLICNSFQHSIYLYCYFYSILYSFYLSLLCSGYSY